MAAARSLEPSDQPNIGPLLAQSSNAETLRRGLNIDAILFTRFDNQLANSFSIPILMTNRFTDLDSDDLTESWAAAKRQSLNMLTGSQNAHDLALQSIMDDFQNNFVTEQDEPDLLANKRSFNQGILASEAVDEFHANLVGAID